MEVVNKKYSAFTVYIGRPSIFGNPYYIGQMKREEVLRRYAKYARSTPKVMEAIAALSPDDVLGCYCAPLPCHGDIIVQIWKEIHGDSHNANQGPGEGCDEDVGRGVARACALDPAQQVRGSSCSSSSSSGREEEGGTQADDESGEAHRQDDA